MSWVARLVAHCDRCGHEWITAIVPIHCSRCKTRRWNQNVPLAAPTDTQQRMLASNEKRVIYKGSRK